LRDFAGLRIRAHHLRNIEDFECAAAANIRNDLIFVTCMFEQDGLGSEGKEINERRASQAEGLRRNAEFQHLPPVIAFELGDQDDDFGALAEVTAADFIETVEVHEEELLREAEILLEQPVSDERAHGI